MIEDEWHSCAKRVMDSQAILTVEAITENGKIGWFEREITTGWVKVRASNQIRNREKRELIIDEKSSSKRRFQKDRVAENRLLPGKADGVAKKSFHERSPQVIRRSAARLDGSYKKDYNIDLTHFFPFLSPEIPN